MGRSFCLARLIPSGDLNPGNRLSPQRKRAERLGIALTTVSRAYAKAAARSLARVRGP